MSDNDSSTSDSSSDTTSHDDDEEDRKQGDRKLIDIKTILGKVDQPIREPSLPTKSSNEILTELFGVFNAKPPEIKEPEPSTTSNEEKVKKTKKSKRKHKHKKHKKTSSEKHDKSSNKHKHKKHKKKKLEKHKSKDKVKTENHKQKSLSDDDQENEKSLDEDKDVVSTSKPRVLVENDLSFKNEDKNKDSIISVKSKIISDNREKESVKCGTTDNSEKTKQSNSDIVEVDRSEETEKSSKQEERTNSEIKTGEKESKKSSSTDISELKKSGDKQREEDKNRRDDKHVSHCRKRKSSSNEDDKIKLDYAKHAHSEYETGHKRESITPNRVTVKQEQNECSQTIATGEYERSPALCVSSKSKETKREHEVRSVCERETGNSIRETLWDVKMGLEKGERKSDSVETQCKEDKCGKSECATADSIGSATKISAEVKGIEEIAETVDKQENLEGPHKTESIMDMALPSGSNAHLPAQCNVGKPGVKKITIKNLKFSSVFEETMRQIEEEARMKAEQLEEGEIATSSPETPKQHLTEDETDPVLGNVIKLEESLAVQDNKRLQNLQNTVQKHRKKRRRSKSTSTERKSRSKDKQKKKKSRSRSRELRKHGSTSSRGRSRSRNRSRSRGRSGSRYRNRSHSSSRHHRKRYRSKSSSKDEHKKPHSSSVSKSEESPERFDKKKLLEIARKNLVTMVKQGTLPKSVVSQDKALAVAELTDFCKELSKKEAEEGSDHGGGDSSDNEGEKAFHHPFQIKERPSSIVVNIRNSVQLPLKTLKEKAAEQSKQLRILFPVSSGQQHRKTESEWVPVSPKKETPAAQATVLQTKTNPAKTAAPKGKSIFSSQKAGQDLDISSIVSQRLNAMRRLQENPNDVQAMSQMYSAQKAMQSWAESKQEPGQFTGSTGARVLSPAELAAGYQAWAKKDQFAQAVPVSGGMGMTLLQKMGWRPGEGLGKNKEGSLEPLTLEIKMDKRGLMSQADFNTVSVPRMAVAPQQITPPPVPPNKHPVSILMEMCTKRKWSPPMFELIMEDGPGHMKNFLFKVHVNGVEYKPSVPSPNKKQAKLLAASICLDMLGIPH